VYVPKLFRSRRPDFADTLLATEPWGLLITAVDENIRGSHLPFVYEPSTGENGRLHGHMNRANPHWRDLERADEAMVVVTGPGAYVSPELYEVTPAAPSYNYTVVHVYGTPTLVEGSETTLALLRATVERFEQGPDGRDWDIEPSLDYARRIVRGVVAFTIDITRLDAAAKLSQNKTPELQDRVERAFAASHNAAARAVAHEMREEKEWT